MAAVHAWYFTDPASPGSWAIEPALRRLQVQFGDGIDFTYVMGGMAREFSSPLEQVRAWLDAGDASGMPVDPRLWLDSPPKSSYPACLAVKAASEQGPEVVGVYLRRLREGFAYERRRLDTTDGLMSAAREVGALGFDRFQVDLQSNAIAELFGADLDRAARVAEQHHGAGSGRVRMPAIEFRGDGGDVHGVYGVQPAEAYVAAATAAGAAADDEAPGIEDALRRFGNMATVEVAAACDLPGPRAAAELWRLAAEWRVRAERRGSGELWSPT